VQSQWKGLEATQRGITIALEQQINERFTRAVNQLGSNKLNIRLGGIYALEKIATDYPQNHTEIMEILAAYVRDRSQAKIEEYQNSGDKKWISEDIETKEDIDHESLRDMMLSYGNRALLALWVPFFHSSRDPDIEAVLKVIGRRSDHLRF